MKLVLSTYDGTSITTYTPSTGLLDGDPPTPRSQAISSERVEDFPSFGGKSFMPTEFDMNFAMRSGDTNRNTDKEALGKLFDPRMKRTLKTLVATDSLDSSKQYYIECTPLRFPKIEGGVFKVRMWTNDPVWKTVTPATDSTAVTSSPTNDTITNNGNVDAYPTITITPTTQGGGYLYRRHVIIRNPLGGLAQNNHPLDITGGGLDFTGLTKDTSKSNQINVGAGISNSATTWAIDTAVGGGLPSTGGYFMMENEQCSYTSISGGTTINGVTRGINGTTAATHADNVVMYQSLVQADGDDIRVMINGVEVERWLSGTVYSDTTLKIWNVSDWPPGISMTLKTTLASSGETRIVLKNTEANKKAINRLPDKGILYLDTEAIAYTSKNINKLSLTIANNGRGIKDTTAAGHTAGITFYWIPLDIVIVYGNMTAETPVQTDIKKPCFSLDNSTNTNWRYDSADSTFGDVAGLRAGAWKPSRPKGVYSNWYTGDQGTFGTDPVTDMGAEIVSYQSGALYKVETARMLWTLSVNAGFTSISSLGEKYKSNSNTPWPTTRLQSSKDAVTWVNEWTEATPGSAATWTAWTHASESVPSGTKHLRFDFFGAVNAVSGATARNEVNLGSAGSMGVSLESANVPQITVVAQATSYFVDFTLDGTTTGEGFSYALSMKINTALTINTKDRTVSYEDRLLAPPELNSTRMEWFRLQPGANDVTYTANSTTGNVTVGWSWEERKNV